MGVRGDQSAGRDGLLDHGHDAAGVLGAHRKDTDALPPSGILRPMTTSRENDLPGELLLVAIVEMAPGNAVTGQRYEDTVLGLLGRHGGSVERRMRSMDSATEVHIIRFRSRAGYESFMTDPDRLAYRDRIGDAAPTTRVLEVREV